VNKIYRLVWNATLNAWVVACEFATAKGKGKSGSRRKLALSSQLAAIALAGGMAGEALAYSAGGGTDGGNASNTSIGLINNAGVGMGETSIGYNASATGGNATSIGVYTLASGTGSLAVGTGASAAAANGVAIGPNATVTGISGIAVGSTASSGENSIAMGTQAKGGYQAIAIGEHSYGLNQGDAAFGAYASATGSNSTAIGSNAVSSGFTSQAIGPGALASSNYSSAIGANAVSTNFRTVALGTNATASGSQAASFGTLAVAAGDNSVVMGTSASATATDSVAVGTSANGAGINSLAMGGSALSKGASSTAIGPSASAMLDNTVAIGANAVASAVGGVAIGSGSNASVAAGVAGYAPTKAAAADKAAISATVANNAAMDIGSRQITSVAAGTNDSDAVNVAQLKSVENLATTPLTFAGNTGSVAKQLGDTLTVKGAGTTAGTYTGANLKTDVDASGNLNISMTDAPVFTSTTIGGNTLINGTGLIITGGPSVTTSGIDAASKKITNVAAGSAGTDAVNVDQLNTASSGWSATDGTTAANIKSGGSVTFKGDSNVTVSQTGADNAGQVNVLLNKDLNLSGTGSLTIGNSLINTSGLILNGGPSVTTGGINAAGTKITNLEAGTNDYDAVNLSQLRNATVNAAHYYSVNDGGTAGANYSNDGAKGLNAIAAGVGAQATQADSIAMGTSAQSAAASTIAVGAGSSATADYTVAIGGAAVASETDAVALGANSKATAASSMAFGESAQATAENAIAFGSSAAASQYSATAIGQNASATAQGGTAIGARAMANGNDSVAIAAWATAGGENAIAVGRSAMASGGESLSLGWMSQSSGISSVAMGQSAKASAINAVALGLGAQSTASNALAAGVSAQASGGSSTSLGQGTIASGSGATALGAKANAAGDNSVAVAPGSSSVGASSISVGQSSLASSDYSIALGAGAQASVVGGVAIGTGAKASVDKGVAGYAPTKASAADKSAIAATVAKNAAMDIGSRQITNVAAGTQNGDAVNVAQLKSVENLASAGWNVTDGSHTANVGPNGKVTFSGDSNVTVTTGGAQDAGTVGVQLNENLDLSSTGSLTIGNSKLDNTGLVITSGPSVTVAGIDAGSKKITNLQAGVDDTDGVNVSQLKSGIDSAKTHYYSVNDGGVQQANFNNDGATGLNALAAGIGANGAGENSVAMGISAESGGKSSVALGESTQAGGESSIALGTGAKAHNNGDVALGAGSETAAVVATSGTTIAGTDYSFAGANPTSTVSVGSVGNERTLTNVAAGRLSETSTDAVNGSQLFASNQAIDNLNINVDNLDKGAVKYDVNPDGTVNYDSVTLAGGDNGTKITNVAAGDVSADSTDAINGSQLFETNQNVTNLGDTLNNFAGDQTTEYTEVNGRGIRYVRTNDTGLALSDSSAQGQGSTAVGYNATSIGDSSLALGREAKANNANDVALGAGSTTDVAVGTAGATIAGTDYSFAGATPTSTVSVGSVGNERTITNVAAGRLSADSTDAVNGSQLFATNSAIDGLNINIDNLDKGAVKYDTNADGSVNYNSVTLGGDTYNSTTKTGGTKITNVARGVDDSDAVNMSQLNETNTNVTNLGDTLNNFAGDQTTEYTEINGRGIRYVRTNDTGLDLADSSAQGQGSSAVGYNATSLGDSSLALGRDSKATNANDVALGSGSTTDAAVGTAGATIAGTFYGFAGTDPLSTVSVGSKGYERTITNVAAGRLSADSTDAVNGSQLFATNQAVNNISNNVDVLDKGAVKYDVNSDGTVNYNHITLAGGDAGTTISNVAAGEKGTDAVNVDQLNNTVAASKTHYYGVNDNGVQGGNYNNDGAQGLNSVAAGVNAKASVDGGVALGSDSVASVEAGVKGYTPATASAEQADAIAATTSTRGSVSVGDADNGIYRQINGVAAGSADSDAVNVAQLKGAIGSATANAVSYDNSTHNSVTLNGDTYNSETQQGGTTITNVAAGVNDSDAVNMAQLNQTNTTVNNVTEGKDGMFQVNNTKNLPKPKPTGKDSTAGGAGAVASADNSTAIGSNAQASHNNSVALGANSSTDRDNSVAVGSAGSERQITHVAAGTADTDAVNLAQLNKATGDINNNINNVYSDLKHDLHKQDDILSAGIAGALAAATLPQPYVPGASMASIGAGNYRGQQAMAVGVSRISDNGKWVTKLSANTDTQGEFGVSVGVGYQW
jgi:autotransporter adhesin